MDLGNCVSVCIDGVASITAYRLSVVPKNKNVAPKEMLFTLCIIYREHLAATKPPADLINVLDNVVKTVNVVRC